MGGSKTVVQSPTPPAQPSVAQNVSDYVNSLPAMYQAELQYNPLYAEQDFKLASQYYPEYAKMMQQSDQSLYPETAKLQETLAKQANEGMTAAVPESMKAAYLDQLRSEVGSQGSGISADYISRNLINQQKSYGDYYRNLALSVAGRQPLTGTNPVSFQDAGQGYNYAQTSNNTMQGYGSYSSLYGSMYGANAGLQSQANQAPYGLIGAGFQGLGALGGGFLSRR